MAKAKVLKIPARGDWEFAEVETESDGNIPLEAMKARICLLTISRAPAGSKIFFSGSSTMAGISLPISPAELFHPLSSFPSLMIPAPER